MSILTSHRPNVKPTVRRKATADEIILWTVANRQAAKDARDDRAGISIDAWHRMSPPERRAVGRKLVALGCPNLGPGVTPYGRFAAFIDQAVNGVAVAFLETEARLSLGTDFAPTRLEELEALGFDLGFGGTEAEAPDGLTAEERSAFTTGFAQGWADLDRERDAYLEAMAAQHDAMEAMFGGPEMIWHSAELAEAASHAGHPAIEG